MDWDEFLRPFREDERAEQRDVVARGWGLVFGFVAFWALIAYGVYLIVRP